MVRDNILFCFLQNPVMQVFPQQDKYHITLTGLLKTVKTQTKSVGLLYQKQTRESEYE